MAVERDVTVVVHTKNLAYLSISQEFLTYLFIYEF